MLKATKGIPPVNGDAATDLALATPRLDTCSETDLTEVLTTSAIAKALPTFCIFLPPTDSIF